MIEYVILGTSHEIQGTSKLEKPVGDAVGAWSPRMLAEEHPLDTPSVACDVTKHLHIPYLQIDPFPEEWPSSGIDREMRIRDEFLRGQDVRLSHADDIRENFWLDRIEASADGGRVLIICGYLHVDFLAEKVEKRGGCVAEKSFFPPDLRGRKPEKVLDQVGLEELIKNGHNSGP